MWAKVVEMEAQTEGSPNRNSTPGNCLPRLSSENTSLASLLRSPNSSTVCSWISLRR